MSLSFDVVVVGAGLAGAVAATAAARRGCSVALVERGRRPGSKNVIGGILYTPVLERLFPGFLDDAPLERPIAARSFGFLTGDAHVTMEVRSQRFAAPPDFNRSFTVRRAAFDPWLVAQARAAGVTWVPQTLVEGLRHADDDPSRPVVGVRCARAGGDVDAKVVVLAEGSNALLAEAEGLRPPTGADEVLLGVKEILTLDPGAIEDRFALEAGAGRAFEFFGVPARGRFGSGFVYTNRDSLSVGVALSLSHLAALKVEPHVLLDEFKAHPSVRPLLRGAEPVEYCAHLLPVGAAGGPGRDGPALVRDGLLLAGDAARLANLSHYKELTNLVTASGEAAGEAAADAVQSGDTSAHGLRGYEDRLAAGFVLRDVEKYAGIADLIGTAPELLDRYPRLFVESFVQHMTIDERPKDLVERDLLRLWNRAAKPAELRRDLVAVLEAAGFSLMPLIRKAMAPALRPGWAWLRLLWPRRRRGRRRTGGEG